MVSILIQLFVNLIFSHLLAENCRTTLICSISSTISTCSMLSFMSGSIHEVIRSLAV